MHSVLQDRLMKLLVAISIHSACCLHFLIPEDKHTATQAKLRQHWCALNLCLYRNGGFLLALPCTPFDSSKPRHIAVPAGVWSC